MNDSKLSEFSLIHQLTKNLPKYGKNVVIGVGDDCAVLKQSNETYQLVTCDVQVAGVHFLPNVAKPEHIGQKAIAVSLSDIAAMGGRPTSCLVSYILPENIKTEYLLALSMGIKSLCKQYSIDIIGGNLSRGKQLAIDIFMLGEVKPDELLLRSGAKPGDQVLVTGSLGNAAAGLTILKNPHIRLSNKEKKRLLSKQCTPQPRMTESTVIAQLKQATAMIDISDGLASDLGHLCSQSSVGVEIWEKQIPITSDTLRVSQQLHKNPISFALSGGEDYELLFTAPLDSVHEIIDTIQQKTGTQVSVIGEILPKKEQRWIMLKDGKRKPLLQSGWDHFMK